MISRDCQPIEKKWPTQVNKGIVLLIKVEQLWQQITNKTCLSNEISWFIKGTTAVVGVAEWASLLI